MNRYRRIQFSLGSLLVLLLVIGTVLSLVRSMCWRTDSIHWRPIQELCGDVKQNGNVIVVYYSEADPVTYLHRRLVEENGLDVICEYRVETFAVDQRQASTAELACLREHFEEFRGLTGVGVIRFRHGKQAAKWTGGQFASNSDFEEWMSSLFEE